MNHWLRVILLLAYGAHFIQGASLDEQCHDNSDCTDVHTTCQPHHCLGSTCQCGQGYVVKSQCAKETCSGSAFGPTLALTTRQTSPALPTLPTSSATPASQASITSRSTTKATATATPTTTTTSPSVLLGQNCTSVARCADPHASCRPHRCDGMICQCNVGYITNSKLNICDKVSIIGEVCNATRPCLPRRSHCNSTNMCGCEANFQPTRDGFWCIAPGHKALGDTCGVSDNCGIGAECRSGKCACAKWHAQWGHEEKWLGIPASKFSQCENTNLTLNECNGVTFASPIP